ncbi:MAG: AMP-binding protein [Dehalococcoidales bacterium]|nr:AMP-binding protein [Dehalococcoidales bacterium]
MAIKHQVRKDEYFDELETMSAEERKEYSNNKLAETVANAYKNAPAAKRILDNAGVSPSQIKLIKDLESLPVTRKADIIEMQKNNPPYGGFLCIAEDEVQRVFVSPGPIYEPMQHTGIKWFAKSFWAAGFRKGDLVVNTFTYHMSPAGILCHEAIRDCGATAVPVGTGHTEVTVKTMLDLKATAYVGTPSFLMAVIKQAEETGYDFRKDFYVKHAWFTGEMLAPSVRKTLEEDYNIDTYQAYAVTEPGGAIAYECSYKNGLHLMDEYIVEIVNPANGKQLVEGEVGEVVVTPVHNNTWGLIRFGTGDLSSIVDDVCPCGRTSKKLTGIQGRIGEAVKVRGMFVVAKQAESVLSQFKEISRWQISVNRSGQRDEMTITAELCDDACDKTKLAKEIGNKFKSICLINPDRIDFVPSGTIPQGSKAIVDLRKWD